MRWRGVVLMVILVLQWSRPVSAVGPTTKPIGVLDLIHTAADCNPANNPDLQWLKISLIPEWFDFNLARSCSQQTDAAYGAGNGIRWILGIYGRDPLESIATFTDAMVHLRNDVTAAGLLPYVNIVQYSEEWYARYKNGDLAAYGLPQPTSLADMQVGIPIVRDHVAGRQAALKSVFNLPVAFLETYVNNSQTLYGVGFWQPAPAGTDFLIIDAYVPAGGTFTTGPPGNPVTPELVFQTAVATTTLPIAIMPQWFHTVSTTDVWRQPPTLDTITRYRNWLDHPRVVAMVGFTWHSRPAAPPYPAIVGLKDLPTQRCWIKQSLGLVATCP